MSDHPRSAMTMATQRVQYRYNPQDDSVWSNTCDRLELCLTILCPSP
ncbi:MAG TPA: hypothetical protein V6D30_17355 [Leptolyngbyaceae cyanobacterium]